MIDKQRGKQQRDVNDGKPKGRHRGFFVFMTHH
jgi:hypothetical protein